MTVYQISYMHNEFGNCIGWYPTRYAARAAWNKIQRKEIGYDVRLVGIYAREITDLSPVGLAEWLNQMTPNHDNG